MPSENQHFSRGVKHRLTRRHGWNPFGLRASNFKRQLLEGGAKPYAAWDTALLFQIPSSTKKLTLPIRPSVAPRNSGIFRARRSPAILSARGGYAFQLSSWICWTAKDKAHPRSLSAKATFTTLLLLCGLTPGLLLSATDGAKDFARADGVDLFPGARSNGLSIGH